MSFFFGGGGVLRWFLVCSGRRETKWDFRALTEILNEVSNIIARKGFYQTSNIDRAAHRF